MFLLLDDEEVLYGGAARGGKSVALLLAALQFCDVPGYSALILRRTYPELNEARALIPLSHEFLAGTPAQWSESLGRWTFPTSGASATLSFGHMQYELDKYRYQGPSFQFVGFDEIGHFTKTQYQYMFSRLTLPDAGNSELAHVPLRVRTTANPPDERMPGWGWVKQHFLVEGPERGVVFVPSGIDDNPFVNREQYKKSLDHLDPVTRARLKSGDWDVTSAGNMFNRAWFGEPLPWPAVPRDLRMVRYWDLAHSKVRPGGSERDWTVGFLYGVAESGQLYVLDIRRIRDTSAVVEALVRQTAEADGVHVRVRMEQEPAGGKSLVEHYAYKVLPGFDFLGVRAASADPMIRYGPISAAAQQGRVLVVQGAWHTDFFDEIEAAPLSTHDDQLTAWAGAHVELALGYPEPDIF